MISKLKGQMLAMSKHKFASNVCEKALVMASPDDRRALIQEIMTPNLDGMSPIVIMMKDQFASGTKFASFNNRRSHPVSQITSCSEL